MLEKILTLYYMAMAYDTRSPMPHLVGPPGCGKSSSVEQAAEMLGVNLHVINVARLSPLEVEGASYPHGEGDDLALKLLHSPLWTQLKEGDIILMDEFLRGFPEVYNAFLDIFTSRQVAGLVLPKVFIIGASNSVTTYDPALEDRLMHLPVPDIRKARRAAVNMGERLCEELGLMPYMDLATYVDPVIRNCVAPMYDILDSFKGEAVNINNSTRGGYSLRNLIGQAQMRSIQASDLHELLLENNRKAVMDSKLQYVLLPDGSAQAWHDKYLTFANEVPLDKLSKLQRVNIKMNVQLIELARSKKEETPDEPDSIFTDGAPF